MVGSLDRYLARYAAEVILQGPRVDIILVRAPFNWANDAQVTLGCCYHWP